MADYAVATPLYKLLKRRFDHGQITTPRALIGRADEASCAVLIRDTGKFFYRLAMSADPGHFYMMMIILLNIETSILCVEVNAHDNSARSWWCSQLYQQGNRQ
jgi:hypothetical protein